MAIDKEILVVVVNSGTASCGHIDRVGLQVILPLNANPLWTITRFRDNSRSNLRLHCRRRRSSSMSKQCLGEHTPEANDLGSPVGADACRLAVETCGS